MKIITYTAIVEDVDPDARRRCADIDSEVEHGMGFNVLFSSFNIEDIPDAVVPDGSAH